MMEDAFYITLNEFSSSGKVSGSDDVISQFVNILKYILNRESHFYEDADDDCSEDEQFSLYNIDKIKSGKVLDIELSQYIKEVIDEMIENIEADDVECGTDYRKELGWC